MALKQWQLAKHPLFCVYVCLLRNEMCPPQASGWKIWLCIKHQLCRKYNNMCMAREQSPSDAGIYWVRRRSITRIIVSIGRCQYSSKVCLIWQTSCERTHSLTFHIASHISCKEVNWKCVLNIWRVIFPTTMSTYIFLLCDNCSRILRFLIVLLVGGNEGKYV